MVRTLTPYSAAISVWEDPASRRRSHRGFRSPGAFALRPSSTTLVLGQPAGDSVWKTLERLGQALLAHGAAPADRLRRRDLLTHQRLV